MLSKTDTGPVLDFEPFIIEPSDDVRTAYVKVDDTALKMIQRVIPKIYDGSLVPVDQDSSKATRYYKRTPKDGQVSLLWDSTKICDYVRALTHPYPGAFIHSNKGKLLLWQASQGPDLSAPPGSVCEVSTDNGVLIACGSGGSVWLRCLSHDGIEHPASKWAEINNISTGDRIID